MKDNCPPTVAIVLLNYKRGDDTIACINSLKNLNYDLFRIIVVDNASEDGSMEKISSAHPDVTIIASEQNLGYSGGNNLGIKKSLENPEFEYIWLLNNDTTVEPSSLAAMVKLAQNYPGSLVGSKILYPDGSFQRLGNRLNRWTGSLRSYNETEIRHEDSLESISGCSMLIPRMVFETIGLLSEDYFLYFEDNDFCLKAAQHGFLSRVAMNSVVFHHEGASIDKKSPLVNYYYQRNRLILASRFFTPMQLKMICCYTHYRLFRSTIKKSFKNASAEQMHNLAFKFAVRDFYLGIKGKCPHNL